MPDDVVVLVHGIRTRAQWYNAVAQTLREAGFKVELSNYGRFGLLRFILPIPFFRSSAARKVETAIRSTLEEYRTETVSIIAHSFGTYLITWLLEKRGDLKFNYIIFCGSVVKFNFPFQYFRDHFKKIVNEVGTADTWPALAEIVTWGYGSTGAYGINNPGIFDRYHQGVSHSKFLTPQFCRDWWVPVLKGEDPKPAENPVSPPAWLRFLSILPVKYLLWGALAATLVYLTIPHLEKFIPRPPFMLANVGITCRPANIKGAPQATKLLVMIYSDHQDFILQIERNLKQIKADRNSFLNTNVNLDFTFITKKNGYDEYELLSEQSKKDVLLGQELESDSDWTAYTVSVNKPNKDTYIPIPTPFKEPYQMRIFVIMAGNNPSDSPEIDALNRQVSGSPPNKYLLELAELGMEAGEPAPQTQETDLHIRTFPASHQCWNPS
jgi:pimeloyl-ACP methyl ester carboxylesterase